MQVQGVAEKYLYSIDVHNVNFQTVRVLRNGFETPAQGKPLFTLSRSIGQRLDVNLANIYQNNAKGYSTVTFETVGHANKERSDKEFTQTELLLQRRCLLGRRLFFIAP